MSGMALPDKGQSFIVCLYSSYGELNMDNDNNDDGSRLSMMKVACLSHKGTAVVHCQHYCCYRHK